MKSKNKDDWSYANWDRTSDTILLERLIDSINSTLSLLQDNDNMTAGEAITMITQVTDLVTRVHLGIDKMPANW